MTHTRKFIVAVVVVIFALLLFWGLGHGSGGSHNKKIPLTTTT